MNSIMGALFNPLLYLSLRTLPPLLLNSVTIPYQIPFSLIKLKPPIDLLVILRSNDTGVLPNELPKLKLLIFPLPKLATFSINSSLSFNTDSAIGLLSIFCSITVIEGVLSRELLKLSLNSSEVWKSITNPYQVPFSFTNSTALGSDKRLPIFPKSTNLGSLSRLSPKSILINLPS